MASFCWYCSKETYNGNRFCSKDCEDFFMYDWGEDFDDMFNHGLMREE